MKQEDQERFRTLLHEEKEKLEVSLALADPSDESITPDKAIGRLTRMEAIQAQSMNAATRLRHQKRMRAIDKALERIDRGTYGTCMRCSAEIPTGRLEIMPESALFVVCAEVVRQARGYFLHSPVPLPASPLTQMLYHRPTSIGSSASSVVCRR